MPIYYGVTGAEGHAEVEDALGRLKRASVPGGPAVTILAPGEWLDWSAG